MRPDFVTWAESSGGLYLHDKKTPTLATWQDYQADVLRHLFPAGDGPLPYSRIIWSDPKKSGKTELAAGVHIWFALFIETPGEQYVLANDFEGSRARTWKYVVDSLRRNPVLEEGHAWRTANAEITFANGSVIRALPSDYRGDAGANFSLATVDEPWGVVHQGAVRLMTEFSPVPTRRSSTVFYTGYQGWDGESVWWHQLIDSVLDAGEPVPELAHLDDGDGEPMCWRAGRTFLLWNHRPRMPWHTPAYLAEQQRALPASEYLRVWENRRVRNTEVFCTPEQWEALRDSKLRGLHEGDRRPVVLAVDAATKADCTALVGCTWNAELRRVEVVYSQVWRPTGRRPLKLTDTVGPEVVRLHQLHNVVDVMFDPYQMAAIAELCRRASVPMSEFPQTSRRTQADTHLHQLIWGNNLAHTGDPTLAEHVTNAVARETDRGLRLVKQASAMKIDGAVALAMAALGAVEKLGRRATARLRIAENPFF